MPRILTALAILAVAAAVFIAATAIIAATAFANPVDRARMEAGTGETALAGSTRSATAVPKAAPKPSRLFGQVEAA